MRPLTARGSAGADILKGINPAEPCRPLLVEQHQEV